MLPPYRSRKGKLKGLQLQTGKMTYSVKLPKYLRPLLVRELEPNTFVQVWAYLEGNTWQGVNILPLSPEEAEELQQQWQDAPPLPISVSLEAIADSAQAKKVKSSGPKPQCIQVCRKGKCFKQGGKHILERLAG